MLCASVLLLFSVRKLKKCYIKRIQDLIDTINIIMKLLKIPLRPISTNRLYLVSKYHKIYLSKQAKQWTEQCKKIISEQYKEKTIENPVEVTIVFNLTGTKLMDLDNMLRLVINCLQGTIIKNDNQIEMITSIRKMEQPEDKIIIHVVEKEPLTI